MKGAVDRKRKIWPFVSGKNDDLLLGSRAESLLKNLFPLWFLPLDPNVYRKKERKLDK